jgi:hypothetical protein
MSFLDLLYRVPVVQFEKYGAMISFGEICQACFLQGWENHHTVENALLLLEKEGLLTIVYDDDLLIGVKLKDAR